LAIPPFSAVEVTLTLKPVVLGPVSGTLQITSDAEDEASWSVAVSGTGTSAPFAALAPDTLVFAIAPGDAPADKTSVLSNQGGDVLTYAVGAVMELPASAAVFTASAPNTARIYNPDNYRNPFVPGRVIVAFKAGATDFSDKSVAAAVRISSRRDMAAARSPRSKVRSFTARNLILVTLEDKTREGVLTVIDRLKRDPNVAYAEPDYLVSTVEIPNDPSFPKLYGMHNSGQTGGTADADIDAPEAWDKTKGNPNLLIGVIDTGIDYLHPDLAVNIWTNPGEIPGNKLDDEGNGFIDDIHGYDFANNDPDPFDDHYHGTHCAGTIAGAGNNGAGVVGVVWRAKLVALKFLSGSGSGSTEGAINAVAYANAMNIPITSNSWGGGGFSQALKDVIDAGGAQGFLFIAASGNNGADMDASAHYPAGYDSPSIVSVAATDSKDAMAGFSNYGLTTVDLGAPGVEVYSCAPGNAYQNLSGTSMATPHVSGAAALLWSYNYQLTGAQIKSTLMASADPVPALSGKCVSGGRLNVNNALGLAGLPWLTVSPRGPGTIDPDSSLALSATVDASGLTAGRHVGRVEISTNDPAHPSVPLTVIADISGCRKLSVDPSSHLFGEIWLGQSATVDITLANVCNEPVTVTNLGLTGTAFSQNRTLPMSVPAFGETKIQVRFAPTAKGNHSGSLVIMSDAEDLPMVSIPLTGSGIAPPSISVTPAFLDVKLPKGANAKRTITISNPGGAPLSYQVAGAAGDSTAVATSPVYGPEHYQVLADRLAPDPRKGAPVVQGQGGPDGFGYSWTDSDQPGGPAFVWTDISATGKLLPIVSGCLDCFEKVGISFPFSFYDESHDSLFVSSHGYLTFGAGSTQYSNYPLPSVSAPRRMIAGFWDDLYPGGTGDVYYQAFADRMVIQYHQVGHYSGLGTFTFQIVLNRDGSILYYYKTLVGDATSATVGIQDMNGSVGLGIAYNAPFLHDGMAIRIASTPAWLSLSANEGVIPAGGSATIEATFDATALQAGSYGQVLIFTSNSPDGDKTVACSLTVEGLRLRNARAGVSATPVARGAQYSILNLKAGGAGGKLLKGAAYSLVLE
jgi:subtilisin family serine protease